MQIFFLSDALMIALYFILWPTFQVSAAVLCLNLPDKYFSTTGFLFKTRSWELQGELYDKLFKVKKWKRFLPDGGAIYKKGYKKKHLTDYSKENLRRFQIESCKAEMTHLLAIFPFWVFGFFSPPYIILIMLGYSLAFNLPCIITQRYNRPRFEKLLEKC